MSLITFGSYRLGVHRSESDLDVLAMSPPACSRGDFFTSLVEVLQKDSRVSEVHAIPSAFTVRSFDFWFAKVEFVVLEDLISSHSLRFRPPFLSLWRTHPHSLS